jgi:hypothetical protein
VFESEQADAILDTLRLSLRVTIDQAELTDPVTGKRTWLLRVQASNGERWSARGCDRYETACALAELMGFELDDG